MKWFRILGVLVAIAVCQRVQAQTATVTWTNVQQTIDGFGGQTWRSGDAVTSAQADLLFSPTNGIGLAIVRSANTADGSMPDLITLQEAVARGAKIELGLQSPPAFMKDSGNFNGGTLLTSEYGAYATYIVNWINTLAASGVPVTYLSVQNEPDQAGTSGSGTCTDSSCLGSCHFTAAQFDTFIAKNLGPALAAAGLGSVQIMLPEASTWFDNDLYSATLNDPGAVGYVSIVAGHGYGNGSVDGTGVSYCCHTASANSLAASKGKKVWMSEINGGFTKATTGDTNMWVWDPSMADALVWAHDLHDYLTVANVSAWEYWNLASYSSGNYNDGYVDHNFNAGKRYYAVGNWSKFVRPGWVRIDASANPQGGVLVSAFKEASTGNFAVVVVNQNGNAVEQSVSLSGFSSASVTPWVTSASLSLAQQQSVSVANNAFSYSLPAQSVTTFVGVMSGGSAGGHPNPPTGLTAIVH
jgi:glucuronoarabinoxylan endo-1,4-beta-xylanase